MNRDDALNACLICGDYSATRFAVVRWKSGKPEYTAGPRCIDRLVCRDRVEAQGETWDVAESGLIPLARRPGA